ncbi:MAG: carbamoyltransferase [candidate division Zixibacteria bacterium]|nr:carbamoyltransferase [candidate division Zixibacteria bacterium]
MYILGISAFYHDSAAALIADGRIIAAVQEERFSRVKHDNSFPTQATRFCLEYAGITPEQLEIVCYYDKPLLTFERLLETYLAFAPRGLASFHKALPLWLNYKLHLPREIKKRLEGRFTGKLLFSRHHLSHAASAFYPSPFAQAAILTIDGVGEWSTTTIGHGQQNKIELLQELKFPHSLGLLYSAFTYYLGFKVNSGEYKLMGLAPYGKPKYVDLILDKMITVKEDGSFWLNMEYFDYCSGLKMTSRKFEKLFGLSPKKPKEPFAEKHLDIAASIQKVTNRILLRLARTARDLTGEKNLALAGGVALNSVANGLIRRAGIFDDIFIQPASGDAGGAIGAALAAWHIHLDRERNVTADDAQAGSYLGPAYQVDDIKHFLNSVKAVYQEKSRDDIPDLVAAAIEQGKVVGFFQGRMEFGPRALGARSILADARSPEMQLKLNQKIKFRESFRPFAPAVLREDVADYFAEDCDSPYMLLVEPIRESIRIADDDNARRGLEKLRVIRSTIPAVTHVDYSGRLQTVTKERNGFFYNIVSAFKRRTGCSVIVNTSFNIRGEPIVNTPLEAYRCFMFTDMDILVLENLVLRKEDQPEYAGATEYRQSFQPD